MTCRLAVTVSGILIAIAVGQLSSGGPCDQNQAGKATAVGGIAVSQSGAIYVVGTTSTEGLATPQAFQPKGRTFPDAFLARFDR